MKNIYFNYQIMLSSYLIILSKKFIIYQQQNKLYVHSLLTMIQLNMLLWKIKVIEISHAIMLKSVMAKKHVSVWQRCYHKLVKFIQSYQLMLSLLQTSIEIKFMHYQKMMVLISLEKIQHTMINLDMCHWKHKKIRISVLYKKMVNHQQCYIAQLWI